MLPALKTVLVRNPAAKKAKYMIAAGCEMDFGKSGGSAKETDPLLWIPISTSNNSIKRKNKLLNKSFAFIAKKNRALTIGPRPPQRQ